MPWMQQDICSDCGNILPEVKRSDTLDLFRRGGRIYIVDDGRGKRKICAACWVMPRYAPARSHYLGVTTNA